MTILLKEIRSAWWDFASISTAQIILLPLGIVSVSLSARLLGPTGYGTFAIFLSIAQLGFLFSINWTSSSLIRFGKEEVVAEGSVKKVFWSRSLILVLCWFLSVVILRSFQAPLARYMGLSEEWFWLAYLMVLAIALSNHLVYLLQALGLMKQSALVSLSERIFYVGLLLSAVLLLPSVGVVAVITIAILAKALQVLLACLFPRPQNVFPVQIDRTALTRIVSYSWPLIFAFTAGYLVDWIDLYVIRAYFSLGEVGVYQIAYQGRFALAGLLMTIPTIMFPIITALRVSHRSGAVRWYLTRLTPQVVLIWSLLLAFISMASPLIFRWLFGETFMEGVLSFRILLLGVAFQSVSVLYTSVLTSYDLLKWSTTINILAALMNLLGDLLLVPRIGISGAAVATTLAYMLSSTLYLAVGNRRLDIAASRALLCPFPALVILGANLSADSVALQLTLLMVTMILALLFARWSRLFSREDVQVLEQIEMPIPLKQGVRYVILALSR